MRELRFLTTWHEFGTIQASTSAFILVAAREQVFLHEWFKDQKVYLQDHCTFLFLPRVRVLLA
jgi:hypothetical protein